MDEITTHTTFHDLRNTWRGQCSARDDHNNLVITRQPNTKTRTERRITTIEWTQRQTSNHTRQHRIAYQEHDESVSACSETRCQHKDYLVRMVPTRWPNIRKHKNKGNDNQRTYIWHTAQKYHIYWNDEWTPLSQITEHQRVETEHPQASLYNPKVRMK